ncbi:MAG: carbohydrate ABC transporter permease [Deltaproteobacteria bacterium]|jgi:multiple sugar transport system permease protein|nr:carbohydrate ABC transporter permease [Deltaproteobacteria bacterium]
MGSGKLGKILGDCLLVALFIFFMFPIYWVATMSFKSDQDILSWPPKFVFSPTMSHYKAILMNIVTKGTGLSTTVDFPSYFKNSLVVCLLAVAISLVIGTPAAYAFARFKFKGSDSLAFNFLTFRFAPEMLVIIPIYLFYTWSGLYNTYMGLVWVYQLITLPMVIWILRGYFEDVPVDLEQAGRLDGYSRWSVALRITLPIVKPGLAATALLTFIYAWNNFIFGMILGGVEVQPVTVAALQFISAEKLRYGDMAAGSVLAAVPILILAVWAQKYLIRGLSLGAVKQ